MNSKAPISRHAKGGVVAAMTLVMAATIVSLGACTAVNNSLPANTKQTTDQKSEPSFHIENFDWHGTINENRRLELINPWGDIRVRTSRRGGMRVTATIQDFGADAFNIAIHPDATSNQDEAIADNPTSVIVDAGAKHPKGRVDMTVLVPPGMTILAVTDKGLAEIKYSGVVHARSQSGKIFIKTAGHVDASSISGDIDVALSATTFERPASIRTDGNINAWIVPAANINIVADGGGGVKIEVPYRQDSGNELVFGDGGESIVLSAGRGSVRVRALPPG